MNDCLHKFDAGPLQPDQEKFLQYNHPETQRKGLELRHDSQQQPRFLSGSAPWTEAEWLVADVRYEGTGIGMVLLNFHANDEKTPKLFVRFAVLPGNTSRITFPLKHLDGNTVFLPRAPGRLKAIVQGARMQPTEIKSAWLGLVNFPLPQTLIIESVWLSKTEPEYPSVAGAMVDDLGQWIQKKWPGKVRNKDDLIARLPHVAGRLRGAVFPEHWNKWGGSKEITFKSTGFFRTHKDRDCWWLVDPDGGAFFSTGLNCIRPFEGTAIVPGEEGMHSMSQAAMAQFPEAFGQNSAQGLKIFNYMVANLVRVYGPEWFKEWSSMTASRMKSWRFNTIANWSDPKFARSHKLPYVISLDMSDLRTDTLLFRDFPDVFSYQFEEKAKHYASALSSHAGDPALLGYFMGNEPHWGFGKFNLAAEMLKSNLGTSTRLALSGWISKRYKGDCTIWNEEWGCNLSSFEDLEDMLHPSPETWTPKAMSDLWEFSRTMVRRFMRIPTEACKKTDPHHLNLGMRFAWMCSDLFYDTASFVDVFSLNHYNYSLPTEALIEIGRLSDKPVIIGEFHFGALDRGLPATGLRGVASQKDRGKAYKKYVQLAADHPQVVGTHYFTLNDQSFPGRFDGENFQIGLVDICHLPHSDMLEWVIKTNEEVYEVRSGEKKPDFEEPELAPTLAC